MLFKIFRGPFSPPANWQVVAARAVFGPDLIGGIEYERELINFLTENLGAANFGRPSEERREIEAIISLWQCQSQLIYSVFSDQNQYIPGKIHLFPSLFLVVKYGFNPRGK